METFALTPLWLRAIVFAWAGATTVALYYSYTDIGQTPAAAVLSTVCAPVTAIARLTNSLISLFKKP